MKVGEMEEVCNALVCEHPYVEFDYKNVSYIIQPEAWPNGKSYFVIWTAYSDKENICLYEETFLEQHIEKEVVDKVLNAKCFDGKSFVEIANDVELTWIFGAG